MRFSLPDSRDQRPQGSDLLCSSPSVPLRRPFVPELRVSRQPEGRSDSSSRSVSLNKADASSSLRDSLRSQEASQERRQERRQERVRSEEERSR